MDYATARDFLYSLRYHGAKYGLGRMEGFVEALEHPEGKFPIIHVAGTNGKGSTCAMLESVYRAAGYKTGLFTSPHLVRQGERIQTDRQILPEESIAHYTAELKEIADKLEQAKADSHPSFFEFMAAMAFVHFAREKVDIGIVETGLGGRLDATNVVNPELSIITSISLDHTEILGDTIEAIAAEKAGIIKPGKPVVIGELPGEAEQTIRQVADQKGSPVHSIRERFTNDYPETNLNGEYQRRNAACAQLALELLFKQLPVSSDSIQGGLNQVSWAGRWDVRTLLSGQRLILDATHNEEGATGLRQNLKRLNRSNGERPIIVAGTLGEKRGEVLMPLVAEFASQIILLEPHQPRALTTEQLRSFIPFSYNGQIGAAKLRELFPTPGICTLGEAGDTIIVTGSIYLIGEVMAALEEPVSIGDALLQDMP